MQNFDPALETRILKTLLDTKQGGLLSTLNTEWFGMPVAQEIWGRIEILRNNGKAIPSSETLATDPVLSEKAQMLLKGVVKPFDVPDVENAVDQLDRLRKGRVIYNMLRQVTDIVKTNDADLPKAQAEIEKCLRLFQSPLSDDELLSYGGSDPDPMLTFYESVMDRNVGELFIPVGYNAIDAQQGGLARGRVYTIGAPSGGGKSTLANSMAVNIYRKANRSVGYYSFEMNREECLLRTQANISRIPADRFQLKKLTPDERKKSDRIFAQFLAHGEKNGCRLDYHCPSKDINISELLTQAEHQNYDVVVVDYINLMAPLDPKNKLWENIGESFRLVKRWAEKTQKVVIMIVQIDEETGGIKYAKSIKHHSDGVWIWKWGEHEKETGEVEVEQIKLRSFKPMNFKLQAEFEFCSFTEAPAGSGMSMSSGAPKPMNL